VSLPLASQRGVERRRVENGEGVEIPRWLALMVSEPTPFRVMRLLPGALDGGGVQRVGGERVQALVIEVTTLPVGRVTLAVPTVAVVVGVAAAPPPLMVMGVVLDRAFEVEGIVGDVAVQDGRRRHQRATADGDGGAAAGALEVAV